MCQAVMGLALELIYRSQDWSCIIQEPTDPETTSPLEIRAVTDERRRMVYFQAHKHLRMSSNVEQHQCSCGLTVLVEASDDSDAVCISYVCGEE
jgi:hypothetical protein